MRNIRLVIAYDGTELKGYQWQPEGMTVQAELERALSIVCDEPITIYGASRTDAGVHANFQVASFLTRGTIPAENLLRALIAHLPPFIVVKRAEEVELDWKPRWRQCGKKYSYTIHNALTEDPLHMRFHWHVKKPLDIEAMREAAVYLVGTHDFSTFQGKNSTPANPEKTIWGLFIYKDKEKLRIEVYGDGFLYHMVRNIAGYLVDIGLGRKDARATSTYLEGKNRQLIGKTAPPQGLCLEAIFFTPEDLQQALREAAYKD